MMDMYIFHFNFQFRISYMYVSHNFFVSQYIRLCERPMSSSRIVAEIMNTRGDEARSAAQQDSDRTPVRAPSFLSSCTAADLLKLGHPSSAKSYSDTKNKVLPFLYLKSSLVI